MLYKDAQDVMEKTRGTLTISAKGVTVADKAELEATVIDELVYNLCLNESPAVRNVCAWVIWAAAAELGIYSSSIQGLYEARGKEKYTKVTVPAVNIRGLTYDVCRALVRTGMKHKSLTFAFEIAKSEIEYTFQRPQEYAALCLAAAVKEGFSGPLFILGDHFQLKEKNYLQDARKEVDSLKKLIKEAVDAGFYNIDIDSSTLVDLNLDTVEKQQWTNADVTAQLAAYIREIQPKGIMVSVGGEIGEVGGKNTTPEEFTAFMQGFRKQMAKYAPGQPGISKISIQTGTAHGGVVLADGSIAKVNLDFGALEKISQIARRDYGLSGTVQHGASTLPDDAFHRFPETETAEVHLATGFQNLVYESKHFPAALREKIYAWLKENCAKEWKEGLSEEQFIYKTRKKGFGPFKKELMDLPEETRNALGQQLEGQFSFIFEKLNAVNTQALVNRYVNPVRVANPAPEGL